MLFSFQIARCWSRPIRVFIKSSSRTEDWTHDRFWAEPVCPYCWSPGNFPYVQKYKPFNKSLMILCVLFYLIDHRVPLYGEGDWDTARWGLELYWVLGVLKETNPWGDFVLNFDLMCFNSPYGFMMVLLSNLCIRYYKMQLFDSFLRNFSFSNDVPSWSVLDLEAWLLFSVSMSVQVLCLIEYIIFIVFYTTFSLISSCWL